MYIVYLNVNEVNFLTNDFSNPDLPKGGFIYKQSLPKIFYRAPRSRVLKLFHHWEIKNI